MVVDGDICRCDQPRIVMGVPSINCCMIKVRQVREKWGARRWGERERDMGKGRGGVAP